MIDTSCCKTLVIGSGKLYVWRPQFRRFGGFTFAQNVSKLKLEKDLRLVVRTIEKKSDNHRRC